MRTPLPPRADSVLRDTLARRDSLHPPVPPRDTIQPPLARAEAPPDIGLGGYVWTRDSIFAGGVATLADLLERVPGTTSLRVGWLGAPSTVAYLGDVARVRVFVDGLEMDALDPRDQRLLDLGAVPLWPMEEVRIEQGASELRVYMRTWRVERTTPSTRADVFTGDQQTNLFRLYFGRRYEHGEALQVAGQQYSARSPRIGANSDELSLLARVGWARRGWSADAFVLRGSPHRGEIQTRADGATPARLIPTRDAARADAYVRLGYGDPEAGPWAQLLAGGMGYKMESEKAATSAADERVPDSTAFHGQYLLTGGFTRGPLRASAAGRLRTVQGRTVQTPSARLAWTSRLLAASAFAEGRSLDSTSRVELLARVAPLSWVRAAASAGRLRDERGAGDRSASSLRAEGELRIKRLWLGGGVLRRDGALLESPTIFGAFWRDTVPRVLDGAQSAAFVTVRGTLYGALKADVTALQWQGGEGLYRPRYQTRSQLYVSTSLPRRFPTGNFGLLAALRHEYRSSTLFPMAGGGTARVGGHRTLYGVLEIRIVDAVLSWQFRNMLVEEYQLVPSFPMTRQMQYYGVRWSFWN